MRKACLWTALFTIAARTLFVTLFCVCTINLFADNRYWVATTSSEENYWSNSNNWSTSPTGTGGASVPSINDLAIFGSDASKDGNCILDVEVKVNRFVINSGYNGAITQGAQIITISNGGANLEGGSFIGGSGNITVDGNFTINGTTFTSTSAVLEIGTGYNFTLSTGGSFIHNNGTVKLNLSANRSITGNLTFHNLIFHNDFDPKDYYISSGSNLIVNGLLTISGNASTTLKEGTIEARGNVLVTNTYNSGGGSATLLINGTGDQTLFGNGGTDPGRLPNVIIDKASGILNLTGTIAVGKDWIYKRGTINPGSSRVIFAETLTIAGTQTFNDVEFKAFYGEYIFTIASGTILKVNQNLYLDGTGGVTLNTGTIEVKGDITITNKSIWSGGDATILINGTGTQTITGSGVAAKGCLPKVHINKPAETDLQLTSVISTSNDWTYTSGNIIPGNSKVVYARVNNATTGGIKITGTQVLNDIEMFSDHPWGQSYEVASGTKLTASGSFYFSGSGYVAINTGIIEVKGDVQVSNKGIPHSWSSDGTATILINGSGNQIFSSTSAAGQGKLPHILINKTSGELSMSCIINVTGNWVYEAGDVNANPVNATPSNVIFWNGNSIDAQGANGSIMNFYDVTMGDRNMRTLLGNININHALNLDSGRINLNGYTCYLDWNSPQAISVRSSIITGKEGYVVSEWADNSSKLSWRIGAVKGAYRYPFATTGGTAYIPFVFELTDGDAGVVTVSTYNTAPDNKPYPATPDKVENLSWGVYTDFSDYAVDRFWQIDKTGSSGTATVTYTYAPNEATGGVVRSKLHAQRYNKSNNTWQNPRYGQIANADDFNVTEPGVTQFSPRTLVVHESVQDEALPVKLISFTAEYRNKKVEVKWATSTEEDHDHFVVERSADGKIFKQVGSVKSNGNSNTLLHYLFVDGNPLSGISYYRLKMVDIDGSKEYSKIVRVNGEIAAPLMLNSIAHGTLTLTISGIGVHEWIRIYDAGGRLMYQRLYDGFNRLELSTAGWSKGVYVITAGNERSRFIVQ